MEITELLAAFATIVSGLFIVLTFFGIKHYKDILSFYRKALESTKRQPEWVLLFQNNEIYTSKKKRYIRERILKNKRQVACKSKYKHPQIEQIVFTPLGRRVTLFFVKGERNQDVCYPVFEEKNRPDFQLRIEKLCDTGAVPRQIAFAPNGSWTILYDLKGRRACEVSEGHSLHYGFTKKINALSRRKNEYIQHIAFTPNGGWIILINSTERDYPCFKGVNKSNYPGLITEINKSCRQRRKIKQIIFISEQNWIILFENGEYYPMNVMPEDSKREVDSYEKKTIRLKQIAIIR